MRYLFLVLLQFCFVFKTFSQSYRWPADYTGSPKIGFNYGVNEEAGIAFDFHQGIDISVLSQSPAAFQAGTVKDTLIFSPSIRFLKPTCSTPASTFGGSWFFYIPSGSCGFYAEPERDTETGVSQIRKR